MIANIEEFAGLIPDSVLDVSGKVFISDRKAFGSPSKLYILGLNPGGAPEANVHETVRSHTEKVLHHVPDDWSALTDEAWGKNGHRIQHPMQRNVLHLLRRLGFDHRSVPCSDLVFVRSQYAAKLDKRELEGRTDECWPFHRAVIARLGVRVIVCLGGEASEKTRARLQRDECPTREFAEVDRFVEVGGREIVSRTYRNGDGLTVVRLAHPSRFHWTRACSH